MKILLAVTGSISAYKTYDLARGLINLGHEVKVILSKGALEFVTPQVYRYLGVSDVFQNSDDFLFPNSNSNLSGNVLHVELGKWSDRLIVAPASANFLSKMARGEASDLLTSVLLAYPQDKAVIIFPAMNSNMLAHPFTSENLSKIQKLKNVVIHGTRSGKLVCGDEGAGKLLAVEELIVAALFTNPFVNKKSKKVMITTGATVCPLDPVRYLTNSSSGLTGLYLAETALSLGFQVELISGIYATKEIDFLANLPGINVSRVKTPFDMEKAVMNKINDCDFYISSAAVSDFVFKASDQKIKKKTLTDSLPISKAPDILEAVIKKKNKKLKIVGFAAETDSSEKVIKEKYLRKPVDLLIGTEVNNGLLEEELKGFNKNSANYKIYKKSQKIFAGTLSKKELASFIFKNLE